MLVAMRQFAGHIGEPGTAAPLGQTTPQLVTIMISFAKDYFIRGCEIACCSVVA